MSQLSSGMLGLVVGAVLGLLLTVLFEENLKSLRGAAVAVIRRARARGRLPTSIAEFRIGPLQTTVLIVEGDGQQVIDELIPDALGPSDEDARVPLAVLPAPSDVAGVDEQDGPLRPRP